jgi:hypothetical protein
MSIEIALAKMYKKHIVLNGPESTLLPKRMQARVDFPDDKSLKGKRGRDRNSLHRIAISSPVREYNGDFRPYNPD